MTPVLETKSLQKSFGAVNAARNINVAVGRGECLGLIGNNGAGKTTFVNIVTGYLRPDAGRVILDGADITALAPRLVSRHGVSRSFQIPQLFGSLTAEENILVALGIAYHGRLPFWKPALAPELADQLDGILTRFRLTEYRDRPMSILPGGIRKLVDIAMAITRRPKLLLLDEPTSGVAVDEKFPLMEVVMSALGAEDATVIFVEHDMDIIGRYAGRVLAFNDGQIIADAEPATVLRDPQVQRLVTGMVR
jgi:branched-chain amino acid transport system ATP-binding protein